MNPRRWGGMLLLLMALVLLGYSIQMRPLPVTRAQGEQVWGGDPNQCVGTRYDCPDPKYNVCSPGTGFCYQCSAVSGAWTGCVAIKDPNKSCTVTGTGTWCGKLWSGSLNNGVCGMCQTQTMFNCGVQSGATGSGCYTGP